MGDGKGCGVFTTSTTIRLAGPEFTGVGVTATGATGTTICVDRSTSPRPERDVFSTTTGDDGVTVGGTSAGVGTIPSTAGSGAAGGGSGLSEGR